MKYLKYFKENMDLSKSIISKKMAAYDKLKELMSKNLGYIGKFTEYLMEENISLPDLEKLYKDILNLKSKNHNIDISKMKYEKVVDKIQSINNDLLVKGLINRFPLEQKEIAKSIIEDSKSNYNLILQTSKKDNLDVFLSKVSRYKTEDELLNALKIFSKDSFNNREEIIEYVNKSKDSNIVFQNDEIMIVNILDIVDIQKLGSDTSWCILGAGFWKTYTKDRYQFILYDFTKDHFNTEFKIGFTLNNDASIYAAHDILDNACKDSLRNVIGRYDGLKLSNLIIVKEIEPIDVSKINTRTTVVRYTEIANNCQLSQIPAIISKLLDGFNRSVQFNISLSPEKSTILRKLLDRYFANKDIVFIDDIGKIDKRLVNSSFMDNHRYYMVKDKLIGKNGLDLSKPSDLISKYLDICSDNHLIEKFSSFDNSLYYICDSRNGYKLKWTKDVIVKLSNRLNDIFNKNDLKDNAKFISNYASLNYLLGRKDIVSKDILNKVPKSHITQYYDLFKLPIGLHDINGIDQLSRPGIIQYIIKKDYEKRFHIGSLDSRTMFITSIENLINHLKGFKLNMTIRLKSFKILQKNASNDAHVNIYQLVSKFKKSPKVGDYAISDDGKIKIEII